MARKRAPSANGEESAPKQARRPRKPKADQPVTSKQRLSTTIKRVRDKLREDAGISTDAERLPQLTWMLFLKFLDDHEKRKRRKLVSATTRSSKPLTAGATGRTRPTSRRPARATN